MHDFRVLDFGTNAARSACIRVHDGSVEQFRFLRIPHKLAQPVLNQAAFDSDDSKNLHKVLEICAQHFEYNDASYGPVFAFGTSIFRRAQDIEVFRTAFRDLYDSEFNVIDGSIEARAGALAVQELLDSKTDSVITLDTGGGSSEVTIVNYNTILFAQSLPVGTQVWLNNPKHSTEWQERLDLLPNEIPERLFGIGGSAQALHNVLKQVCAEQSTFSLTDVHKVLALLNQSTDDEKIEKWGVAEDRIETLPAFCEMLAAFMEQTGVRSFEAVKANLIQGLARLVLEEQN